MGREATMEVHELSLWIWRYHGVTIH